MRWRLIPTIQVFIKRLKPKMLRMDEYWKRELAAFEEFPISQEYLRQRELFRLVIVRPNFLGPCLYFCVRLSNNYQLSHTIAKQLTLDGQLDGQLDIMRDTNGEFLIVEDVRTRFGTLGFWNWPAHDSTGGIDGETWTIEGASYGRFNRVERWEPDDSAFLALAFYLATLCGYDLHSTRGSL